jgi:hypothetical protein
MPKKRRIHSEAQVLVEVGQAALVARAKRRRLRAVGALRVSPTIFVRNCMRALLLGEMRGLGKSPLMPGRITRTHYQIPDFICSLLLLTTSVSACREDWNGFR